MFSKRSSHRDQPVPRRRQVVEDDSDLDAFTQSSRPRSSARVTPPVSSSAPSAPQGSSTTTQFRRNQTLSSYRHTTPDESARQKAHQLTRQRRRLGGIFFIVAIVAVTLLLLLWQLIAQVQVATSTKQLTTPFNGTKYEQIINEYLTINPAQRLKLALDEDALSAYVANEAPEVEKVALSGSASVAQASMAITFRTPVAGWQINSQQYYVDASGVVFETNYYATPKVQIVDESGITPDQGGAVVGTRLLGFLGRVVAQAQGRGYTVVKAALPANTTRQVDVSFKDIKPSVKFSVDRGAGEQMEDADRSLTYLKAHDVTPEYVDVRVAGRAAYK